ncbi:MAG: hypothetical protein J6C49_02275 [Elusimicrobiaceae bacterium]|nr:hypothetical protein [Elusimicrobiaceae bacterium]
MAASENKPICEQNSRQIAQPVLQGTSAVKIYQGSLVDIKNGGVTPSTAAGTIFGGIAVEYAEVEAGSAEAVSNVRVMVRKDGTWEMNAQSLTAASLGKEVEVVDNDTVKVVGTTAGNKCGVIREVISATKALVCIDGYAK